MKKLIVFEEEEFNSKYIEFIKNILKQMNKGYGISIISNEDNQIIKDENGLLGSLYLIWNDTFKTTK